MKRIYLSIGTLLVCAGLIAQTPVNRTTQTVVADVVAQMPAGQQEEYNKLISDLSTTGEEGVLVLTDMLNSPGSGSNAKVAYALRALSYYVMEQGRENMRPVVAQAYLKALANTGDREVKATIIRELQIVGQDESVPALSALLGNDELSGPAARALATIHTEAAQKALTDAIRVTGGSIKSLNNVVLAIGEVGMIVPSATEVALQELLKSPEENTRKVAFYTLGRTGSKASVKLLADAAEKVDYKVENTGANEAYIALLKNLLAQGESKEVEKAANDLLKKSTKSGQTYIRIAALEILLAVRPENAGKLLLTALKDPCKKYRNGALNFASGLADQGLYVDLIKTMAKAKTDEKIDILNWIGRESKCPEKNPVIRELEIRFDLPAKQVLLDQLKNTDFRVKEATVWTLVKIGDPSFIPVLAGLLGESDQQVIVLAQDALAAFKGNIAPAVAKVIPAITDKGKIAGLELLAMRKASANLNTVLEQIKSGSPEVRKTAYVALKDVVTEKDFVHLSGMLETADEEAIVPLQQAVISSVKGMPRSEQVGVVSRRMIQAGESKKHLYYVVLSATGDKDALASIISGFETGSGVAKDAAFEGLISWEDRQAGDILYRVASDAAAGKYFDKAFNKYVQLVSDPSLTGENRLIGLRKAMDIAKTDEQKSQILNRIGRTGTFLGMLYAGNYLDQEGTQQAAAHAVMRIALENEEFTGENVKELLNKVLQVLNNPDADYQRQSIRKRLSEMPDEVGFVSIFNGKDLTGWKGLVENPIARAKMTPAQLAKAQEKADEQMRKDWKVENGLLVFDGTGYDNLCTVKPYGDMEMYVDWMLDPAGPDADGGIYLRGTPQVQIWDTARTNVGAQVGSGGLYNNQVYESNPLKVADNKVGEWNSFYIKMVGDRVTVKLNGELVTDDVILENFWDRSQPIPAIEQLELQAHGSKVYYRDIYVKELERPEPYQLTPEEEKEGYKILFDGTNMHEWTGNTVDYTIEEGCISMIPSKSFGGNLYTKKEYGNFVFRFEFQLTPAANNGLGIRTPMEGDAAYVGMELQILDDDHPVYQDLAEYQYHGSVYGIIPAKRGYLKPVGEWNYQEVIADGDHIKITLNGHVIMDGHIRDAVKNGTPDGKEHPGLFNPKGHIGFLGHGSPVKFRNIRIKELK